MSYSEASYFDGFHFAHIAEWQEAKRLALRNGAATIALRARSMRKKLLAEVD